MNDSPRYRVTRIDGFSRPVTGSGGEHDRPGATFHVVDRASGRMVARYASEDVACGLTDDGRANVARVRAEQRAAELEAQAAELAPA